MSYKEYPAYDFAANGYEKRHGLEGPFYFRATKTVLYYDAREGKYYDPKKDWYVETDDMAYHLGWKKPKTAEIP